MGLSADWLGDQFCIDVGLPGRGFLKTVGPFGMADPEGCPSPQQTSIYKVKGSKLRDRGSGVASHVENIGQPVRWLTLSAVDPARQEAFEWLRDRVIASGGCLTVGKGLSASGICSAFRAMSRRLFNRRKSPPSFYALRHAACAELKASGSDAQAVAKGMGHTSELSQKVYGIRSQGSGCYNVKATASMPVRAVARCISHPLTNKQAIQRQDALKRATRHR